MVVYLNASCCPGDIDEVVEAYSMKTMRAAEIAAFANHLLICDRCKAASKATAVYVRAMHKAARMIRRAQRKRTRRATAYRRRR
jgi:hypothetical protein